ncbi:cysteine peptidase family C39 domain-containing protein [Candidatus Uabimicrobium amorphum]|uniref:Peptidase C39 domain-containing protein n=1 Tax=Uabimicrobium amorphum TaxID=2596890 RepID=A0A5S9ILX4_UABAM|nr:cysteine peptidase family C39 domain-containing protein [Candidatus Uabimicrobium amorphum]BBM83460.1 hypothetical protein UABAM_01812 [Candidatus Uabimicrobium amorphum]
MENMVIFICAPLLFLLCFYAGWICGGKKRKILWTIPPMLFILVLYLLSKFPTADYLLFPFYFYGRLRFFLPLLPLLFLMGIAAQYRQHPSRRVLYSAIAGFCVVAYLYIQINVVTFDYQSLKGRITKDGCCMQSTGHTCGPAAAVTLLLHHGISASESEVARMCGVSPLTGTNEFVLCSVMNSLAKRNNSPLRFKMKAIEFRKIEQQPQPFLGVIRLNGMIAHWIMIKTIDGKQLTIADPLCGVVKRQRADYKNIWLQRCIVIDEKE